MKNLCALFLLSLIASCGRNGSGSSQGGERQPEQEANASCAQFSKNDSFIVTAQKANVARMDCKMSEDDVMKLLKN